MHCDATTVPQVHLFSVPIGCHIRIADSHTSARTMPSIYVLAVCLGADVVLHTADYAREISWSIKGTDCSSGQQTYEDENSYSQYCCLPAGDYVLSCDDSYGDGWGDGAKITIGGIDACEDTSGEVEEVDFTITYSRAEATVILAPKG